MDLYGLHVALDDWQRLVKLPFSLCVTRANMRIETNTILRAIPRNQPAGPPPIRRSCFLFFVFFVFFVVQFVLPLDSPKSPISLLAAVPPGELCNLESSRDANLMQRMGKLLRIVRGTADIDNLTFTQTAKPSFLMAGKSTSAN